LNENSAVCNGYAEAFNLLAHKCNIPSTIVTGTANGGGHAWNYVVLDGEGYYVDTTWDDPIPDRPGRIREDYYLISKEQLMKDHSWVEEDFIDSLFEEQVRFYQ
jgi:transglutaminase/protease-like cytokinesis protein 3